MVKKTEKEQRVKEKYIYVEHPAKTQAAAEEKAWDNIIKNNQEKLKEMKYGVWMFSDYVGELFEAIRNDNPLVFNDGDDDLDDSIFNIAMFECYKKKCTSDIKSYSQKYITKQQQSDRELVELLPTRNLYGSWEKDTI